MAQGRRPWAASSPDDELTSSDVPAPLKSSARRLSSYLHARPRVRLGALLAAPVAWLVIAYLGALLLMFVNAFFSRDAFTGQIIRELTLENFAKLAQGPYPEITLRTLRMAVAVTVIACAVIAFPDRLLHGSYRLPRGSAASWSSPSCSRSGRATLIKAIRGDSSWPRRVC